MLQAEDGGLDVTRTHRSPSRNSQQSNISSLSTVSTPVTSVTSVTSTSNKTPTPSRRGSGCGQGGDPGEVTPQATPTHSRQASLRSRDRSRRGSGTQTPTPRNSVGGPETEANGGLVNGDAGAEEVKHKVNGNTSPLKSKHAADGSNNNDIDSVPSVPCV